MSENTYLEPPSDRTVKIPHLVFGLLFLGVAAIWALIASHAITADRLTVLAPAVLIGAGVVGLVASLASGRNRRRTRAAQQPVEAHDAFEADPEPTSTYPTTNDEPTEEIR